MRFRCIINNWLFITTEIDYLYRFYARKCLDQDAGSDKGDGKMAEDIKISKLNSGDKLYHYTSAEGLMGISNGEIWITEKSYFK